jgi:Predicted membrane protein (DUF2142)
VIGRTRLVLVGVGLALLLMAWVVATRPFDAPDEASHYLRALTIANGHLLGPKVPYPRWGAPAQNAWAQQGARGVTVPVAFAPPAVPCLTGRPDQGSGSCMEATSTGNYHPLPYLLPALALSVSDTASTGLWLSRAASALLCVALIILALTLLWSGSAWSVIGLLAAVTPMVLFVSSVVNPNGLEVAASLAFAAAVLRVARSPSEVPRWVWIALAASGAITILAWQLGPVFVVADLALLLAIVGRRGLRRMFDDRRAALIAGVVLALATVVWLVYGLASGVAHSHIGVHPFLASLDSGLTQLEVVLRDSIGTFGSLTVPLPNAARWIWWILVIALCGIALLVSNVRERIVLGTTVLLVLAFPVVFYAWAYRFSGYGLQGRYLLSLMVLIPLVAGEFCYRHTDRLARVRWTPVAVAAAAGVIAVFQAYAWLYAARDAAGAPRMFDFDSHATWQPPLGWIPWIAIVAVGTLSLLTFAAGELMPARRPRTI